jgi:hypothetical protein
MPRLEKKQKLGKQKAEMGLHCQAFRRPNLLVFVSEPAFSVSPNTSGGAS